MGTDLPVNLGYWLIALIPIIVLLILLVWAKWSAPQAGPVGLLTALLIAMLVFRAPLETVASAAGRGIWDSIFILYVIWPALILYLVADEAGAFKALRLGIEKHTRNKLFLVLALGWVFASFLQGIAGFGTPIAIVAPLLVGIGVRPIMAVVIPLIGHSWANMFGTLAVSWHATRLVVDIQNEPLTALYTGVLLWIPNILAGLAICWLFGRWRALRVGIWAVLIISLIHGGGQLLLTQVNPTLCNFIPATAALAALFLLTRWRLYSEPAMEESPVMEDTSKSEEVEEQADMGLHESLFPYYVLTGVTVIGLAIPAVREALERWQVGLSFPRTETGYGVVTEAESPYSPFSVLTHPGTFLIMASVATYLWYKARGRYHENVLARIWPRMISNAVPASVAILGFLTMSKMMDNTGQTTELALGIAAVSPPIVYAGLANFIGILGAFMTSSNTASNVLFVPLHSQTAAASAALSQSQVIASQSVGGAIGNAIAPANVVLGTGTAGITGQEGEVLRYTLVFAVIAGVLAGIAGIIIYLA